VRGGEQALEERVVVRGVRARAVAAHLEEERLGLQRAPRAGQRADEARVRAGARAPPRRLHVGKEAEGARQVGPRVGLDGAVVPLPGPLLVVVCFGGGAAAADHGAGDAAVAPAAGNWRRDERKL